MEEGEGFRPILLGSPMLFGAPSLCNPHCPDAPRRWRCALRSTMRQLDRRNFGSLVPRTRSSRMSCRAFDRELRVQRGTRIIELLVVLDSEVRKRGCRTNDANFGIGPLVPRTRSSRMSCRAFDRELRVQRGTRIIELLVVLDSEVRNRR